APAPSGPGAGSPQADGLPVRDPPGGVPVVPRRPQAGVGIPLAEPDGSGGGGGHPGSAGHRREAGVRRAGLQRPGADGHHDHDPRHRHPGRLAVLRADRALRPATLVTGRDGALNRRCGAGSSPGPPQGNVIVRADPRQSGPAIHHVPERRMTPSGTEGPDPPGAGQPPGERFPAGQPPQSPDPGPPEPPTEGAAGGTLGGNPPPAGEIPPDLPGGGPIPPPPQEGPAPWGPPSGAPP